MRQYSRRPSNALLMYTTKQRIALVVLVAIMIIIGDHQPTDSVQRDDSTVTGQRQLLNGEAIDYIN